MDARASFKEGSAGGLLARLPWISVYWPLGVQGDAVHTAAKPAAIASRRMYVFMAACEGRGGGKLILRQRSR